MKKAFAVALAVVMICFSGCGGNINENKVGKEQAEEILRCFDEKDSESLKALFCKEIENTHDLDKEIAKAMEFYKGISVSHDNVLVGSGSAVDDGVTTDIHIIPVITNIKTDTGDKYKITYLAYLVLAQNEDFVGVQYITIRAENDETVQIGEYIY